MRKLGFLFVLAALIGCESDPVGYSAPVGINLKVKSDKVVGGSAISDDKNINTENANPYGAFITAARTALGGKNPARIEVDKLTILLGADSKKVGMLEQVFTGEVQVAFVISETNNTYVVGTVTNPTGTGPLTASVTFDGAMVAPQDYTRMLAGSFKVVVRGTASAVFAGLDGEASIQATFTFAAY